MRSSHARGTAILAWAIDHPVEAARHADLFASLRTAIACRQPVGAILDSLDFALPQIARVGVREGLAASAS